MTSCRGTRACGACPAPSTGPLAADSGQRRRVRRDGPRTAAEPRSPRGRITVALNTPNARDDPGGQASDATGPSGPSNLARLPSRSSASGASGASGSDALGFARVLRELTNAERRVARLVAAGLTNSQVARRLDRSPHTINYHLRQIFRKANVRSRTELAGLYYRSVNDANSG